ncbi:glycerophosphodiester phosphodiesterase family protein [Salinibacterium sp. M195]|uniref:glycerophosphodiester phosphodiesterase family protein n=1 Tax=Salinibacterium sp. M195 TaxID=2583374 RepID=UPI001C6294F2|nr:glycerophosphodiester phosphodiesterase family protein [Salinibacterium sp. M195]QYH35411.1 glycerophosphodiester phosphodiesterase [Salinibacterium sp. M195]
MSTTIRPLVIGHRGASGYRPEHTRAAYNLAFTLGADAVEPDIVATRDGVLVLRHENEISGTTNVADHPEFADRRTSKTIDGTVMSGWFTEDFTWEELSTLRARERLPEVRQAGTTHNDSEPLLRLSDLLDLVDQHPEAQRRQLQVVAEIKHATYFASIGLPLDELFAREMTGWATADNLIVESFEQSVLHGIRDRGVPGKLVFLLESTGAPSDLVARFGSRARSFADHLTADGLAQLAREVDGISVDKKMLMLKDLAGNLTGTNDLVDRAHAAGLLVFCWTLRAENRFLPKNLRSSKQPEQFGDWLGEFRIIMDSGLDGVFADQPDLAVTARG